MDETYEKLDELFPNYEFCGNIVLVPCDNTYMAVDISDLDEFISIAEHILYSLGKDAFIKIYKI